MSGSFADPCIDPEYRDTLAAVLFATSRPTRRRMLRSRSQNWVKDGDDGMCWSTVTWRCQHNIRRRRSSRRLGRRAHCGPGLPRVGGPWRHTRISDAAVRIR